MAAFSFSRQSTRRFFFLLSSVKGNHRGDAGLCEVIRLGTRSDSSDLIQAPPPHRSFLATVARVASSAEELLRSLDLSNELDSTEGRMLRMRKVTLQPGGVLGLHDHGDRLAMTCVRQGEVT